jgi:hypothetical protein
MDQFWRGLASEVAWVLITQIVPAIASILVGWLVFWWQKLFKSNFDEKARDTIHSALERGMLHAIQAMKERRGFVTVTASNRSELLADAADYAEKWSSGTIKAKKLSREDLMALAVPHLPLPAGVVLPKREVK